MMLGFPGVLYKIFKKIIMAGTCNIEKTQLIVTLFWEKDKPIIL